MRLSRSIARQGSWAAMILALLSTSACAHRIPHPAGMTPGTPYVSWIIMNGDRDNPDREFVCQSTPRSDCVVPVSRPDDQVFSDVHVYYHGAGSETKYTGSFNVGFFRGQPDSHTVSTDITVRKNESMTNQSVTGIVTSTPGEYAVTFAVGATITETGKTHQIRESLRVIVK